jgi:ABC-type branched-subunit amino acid transport system substrate-binding protein
VGSILFGVSTSLTGATASYGVPTVQSFQGHAHGVQRQHLNGTAGQKLEIKMHNDNSTLTGVVEAAQQMVSDHLAGVVSLTTNQRDSSQQVAVLARSKVPIVSTLSGTQYSNAEKFRYALSRLRPCNRSLGGRDLGGGSRLHPGGLAQRQRCPGHR